MPAVMVGAIQRSMARPGLRSEGVRRANLAAVLRQLHLEGPASRSELGASTGLTRSAVAALVAELVGLGLVAEERASPDGSPGRPSPVVRTRAEENVVLGIEVLVDSIAVAVVGLGGKLLHLVRTDQVRGASPAEQTALEVAHIAGQLLGGLDRGTAVHGVGVAVAGIVRRRDATVMVAPNIGWRNVPFGALLRSRLALDGRVPISVANDADLGALVESRRGVAAGLSNVLYLSGEVGVGGGIVAGGVPLTGNAGFAGEVGHVPVNLGGQRCGCGATGCWETEIGERTLLRRAGRPVDGGRPAVAELLVAAGHGEVAAIGALREQGRWLGIGLAGVVNILDPQTVVLGGLFHRTFPYVHDALLDELRRRVLAAIRDGLAVVPSALGDDAPLLGAAELAWDHVLTDPSASAPARLGG